MSTALGKMSAFHDTLLSIAETRAVECDDAEHLRAATLSYISGSDWGIVLVQQLF